MRGTLIYIVVALVLALAGSAFLLDGMLERRLAIAQEDLAALDFVDPENDYAKLEPYVEYGARIPWVAEGPLREIRARRAAIRYWQADYPSLATDVKTSTDGRVDPDLQFLVANAMYRMAQAGPQDKATILKALDGIIRAYNEVLQASDGHRDAAFNYEYIVRLRDEVASGKRKMLPGAGMPGNELEDKANLHGKPGAPPPDAKLKDFQIHIPMESKEIDDSKEQGAGQGRVRKRRG